MCDFPLVGGFSFIQYQWKQRQADIEQNQNAYLFRSAIGVRLE